MNKNIFLIALLLANVSSYCSDKFYPSLEGFTVTDRVAADDNQGANLVNDNAISLYGFTDPSALEDAQAYRQEYDESMQAALQFKKTLHELNKVYYDEIIRYSFDTSLGVAVGDVKRCIPIETELNTYFRLMKKLQGPSIFINTIRDAQELEIVRDQLERVVYAQQILRNMKSKNNTNVELEKLLKLLNVTSQKLEPLEQEAAKEEPSIEKLRAMRELLDFEVQKLAASIIDKAIVKLQSVFEEKAKNLVQQAHQEGYNFIA